MKKKISYTRINYANDNPTEEEITIDIEEQEQNSMPEHKIDLIKKSSDNNFNNLLRGMMSSISFMLGH